MYRIFMARTLTTFIWLSITLIDYMGNGGGGDRTEDGQFGEVVERSWGIFYN